MKRTAVLVCLLIAATTVSCSGVSPKARFFQPKARIYFDTGSDDEDEIDMFQDGSITPVVNLGEVFWPHDWPEFLGKASWKVGPTFGFGIGSPAQSGDEEEASGAPVLLLTAGFQIEFPLEDVTIGKAGEEEETDSKSIGIEFGVAQGWTTDEGVGDADDAALYFGFTMRFW